jgi:hypothetical protein
MSAELQTTIIPLTSDEIREGLNYVGQVQVLQARAQVLAEQEHALIKRLAAKYNVDLSFYQIRDWLTGFEVIIPPQQ